MLFLQVFTFATSFPSSLFVQLAVGCDKTVSVYSPSNHSTNRRHTDQRTDLSESIGLRATGDGTDASGGGAATPPSVYVYLISSRQYFVYRRFCWVVSCLSLCSEQARDWGGGEGRYHWSMDCLGCRLGSRGLSNFASTMSLKFNLWLGQLQVWLILTSSKSSHSFGIDSGLCAYCYLRWLFLTRVYRQYFLCLRTRLSDSRIVACGMGMVVWDIERFEGELRAAGKRQRQRLRNRYHDGIGHPDLVSRSNQTNPSRCVSSMFTVLAARLFSIVHLVVVFGSCIVFGATQSLMLLLNLISVGLQRSRSIVGINWEKKEAFKGNENGWRNNEKWRDGKWISRNYILFYITGRTLHRDVWPLWPACKGTASYVVAVREKSISIDQYLIFPVSPTLAFAAFSPLFAAYLLFVFSL